MFLRSQVSDAINSRNFSLPSEPEELSEELPEELPEELRLSQSECLSGLQSHCQRSQMDTKAKPSSLASIWWPHSTLWAALMVCLHYATPLPIFPLIVVVSLDLYIYIYKYKARRS